MNGNMIKAIVQNSQDVLEKLINPSVANNTIVSYTNGAPNNILNKLLQNSNKVLTDLLQPSQGLNGTASQQMMSKNIPVPIGEFVVVVNLIKDHMYYQMIGQYKGVQNVNGVMMHIFDDESRITQIEFDSIDIPNIVEFASPSMPSENNMNVVNGMTNNSTNVLNNVSSGSNILNRLLNNSTSVLENLLKSKTQSQAQAQVPIQTNTTNSILSKLVENSTNVLQRIMGSNRLSNAQNTGQGSNFTINKMYKRWVDTFDQIQTDGGVLFKINRPNQTFKENLVLYVPMDTRFIDMGPSLSANGMEDKIPADQDIRSQPTEPYPEFTNANNNIDNTLTGDNIVPSTDTTDTIPAKMSTDLPSSYENEEIPSGKVETVEIDREKDHLLTMYDHPIPNVREITFTRSNKDGVFEDTANRIDVILEKDGRYKID
jgi:hypothetical protein